MGGKASFGGGAASLAHAYIVQVGNDAEFFKTIWDGVTYDVVKIISCLSS